LAANGTRIPLEIPMTLLFKTDNVFYLPPEAPFRIYDLMDWRRIDIRVQSL